MVDCRKPRIESVKIRLFRFICVPILFFSLFSAVAFSQVKIDLVGHHRSEYILSGNLVSGDSATIRVANSNGHTPKKLSADDFLITRQNDTAEIFSCTPVLSSTSGDLAITFILDNSGSMYHSYDSLTKYLDRFIDSLGDGFIANAMAFDNIERKRTFDGTERENLFIASSEFTSDKNILKSFWHFYDTIRTNLTPLYETIIKGLERISDRRKAGDSLRREIMIIVTDGVDNGSSINIEKLSSLARVMPVTLFTVNYNTEPDARLNWLAKKTRGDEFVAANLWQLQKTLDELRKDIALSYKLIFRFPFRGASGVH